MLVNWPKAGILGGFEKHIGYSHYENTSHTFTQFDALHIHFMFRHTSPFDLLRICVCVCGCSMINIFHNLFIKAQSGSEECKLIRGLTFAYRPVRVERQRECVYVGWDGVWLYLLTAGNLPGPCGEGVSSTCRRSLFHINNIYPVLPQPHLLS